MRATESTHSLLGYYRSKKDRDTCQGCNSLLETPINGSIPFTNLISEDALPTTGAMYDEDGNLISTISFFAGTVDIDGTTYNVIHGGRQVLFNNGLSAPAGKYYVEIGDFCSDFFKICDWEACYKIEFGNDCDSRSGIGGVLGTFWIEQIEFERQQTETVSEEKTNGRGEVIVTRLSSKKIESFNVPGNDSLYESLSNLDQYDTVKLVNIETGQEWDMQEVSVQPGEGECIFPLTLSFVNAILSKDNCCDIDSPFIDGCDDNGGDPNVDCTGFDVALNADLNTGLLTYTESNVPANADPAVITWSEGGSFVGSGSSISLGAFGVYTVTIRRGNCVATDSFTFLNPCENMQLTIAVNGPVISGSASGDTNIVIEIINSQNQVIGTGLPFTVPLAQGDGFYTVRAAGDDCEAQETRFVQVTPPLPCDHDVNISVNGAIVTGLLTNCSSLDSEFIEYEDENGNVSTVTQGNTWTAIVTGIYWYNAICAGCLKRVQRLVIVEDDGDDCIKLCPDTCITVQIKDSGDDTKVTLPQ